jgi:17beta-estradiol 17-dehydrogenase / very-long-chain 3-oxoacyl-CoA reductase
VGGERAQARRLRAPLPLTTPFPSHPPSHALALTGAGSFVQHDFIENMIHLNLTSVAEMTALVLPYMLEDRQGAIVNISSAAGNMASGSPLLALYSSTKAAVDMLSRSLYYELAGKGVHVECQVPYFVCTKLSKIKKESLFNVSPETFAQSSLAAVGKNGPSFVPHWSHALQDAVLQALPMDAQAYVQKSMHVGIQKAALRKAEKEKKPQ